MQFQRQRYILFEYLLPKNQIKLNEKLIVKSIWQSMINLFGEYNSYFSGLWIVKLDVSQQWGILRCTNKTKERVITSLAFTSEINKAPILFHTIKTSGTIKTILKFQSEYFQKFRKTTVNSSNLVGKK